MNASQHDLFHYRIINPFTWAKIFRLGSTLKVEIGDRHRLLVAVQVEGKLCCSVRQIPSFLHA